MSAYVPDKAHFDVLVAAAAKGPAWLGVTEWFRPTWRRADGVVRQLELDELDELGDMLLRECVRSVSHTYSDNRALPGTGESPYYLEPYKWPGTRIELGPVAVIKLVHCLEYQSCEHPEWEQSEARRFCEAFRKKLEHVLPGYDEAPWGWEDEPNY